MVIFVDESFAVTLLEPEDLKGFKLVARHPLAEEAKVGAALGRIGGHLKDGHAWVPEAWVRSAASKDAAWQTSFGGVVAYAKKKEWFDDATKSIRAHIEWLAS